MKLWNGWGTRPLHALSFVADGESIAPAQPREDVGTVVALFTRGDDINIESGTPVEMVLQRPMILEEENRARVLCPPGGLGCE